MQFPPCILETDDLKLELNVSETGGWHHIDPALIASADLCWLSNFTDAPDSGELAPASARHLAATCGRFLPPGNLVTGNLRRNGPRPLDSAASALAAYPVMLGDLSEIHPEQLPALQRLMDWFKTLRNEFPLTLWQQSFCEQNIPCFTRHHGSGFLRTSEKGEGLLSVFRNLAENAEITFPIPLPEDIADETRYTLSSWNSEEPLHLSAGEFRSGFTVTMPVPHDFNLYRIERIS